MRCRNRGMDRIFDLRLYTCDQKKKESVIDRFAMEQENVSYLGRDSSIFVYFSFKWKKRKQRLIRSIPKENYARLRNKFFFTRNRFLLFKRFNWPSFKSVYFERYTFDLSKLRTSKSQIALIDYAEKSELEKSERIYNWNNRNKSKKHRKKRGGSRYNGIHKV